MPNASELIRVMKRAALEAVEASKPVNICFGKVLNISPLQVNVEQKMTLTKKQLILTETVTKEPLKRNDEVILLRQQGGQKYVVLDRIGVIT